MNLRDYKESDAIEILSWIDSEREFRLWSADRYEKYPAIPQDINNNYNKLQKSGRFFPLTLEENGKIIGHLIIRNPNEDTKIARLGFIIVDKKIRGKGYGRKLIEEALFYAKEKLGATEINLGVFTNNEDALKCYESVGFKAVSIEKGAYKYNHEEWDCAEMIYAK